MTWTHCPECRNPASNTIRYGHCATCHRTFIGVTTWDDHRRGGQCLNPATEPPERKWWKDNRGRWHRGDRLDPNHFKRP